MAADVDEVVRLVQMLGDDSRHENHDDWTNAAGTFLHHIITTRAGVVAVVDDPEQAHRLVACGVGVLTQIQPTYWNPRGQLGYLQSLYTEKKWRGLGLAGQVLALLVDHFRTTDVRYVHAYAASEASNRLLCGLGFNDSLDANLWIDLQSPEAPSVQ